MTETRFLLALDLDGTLVGEPRAEQAFALWAKSAREHFILAFVTGRSRPSVHTLLNAGIVPDPDIIVSSVGTELHELRSPRPGLARQYAALCDPDWPLDRVRQLALGPGVSVQPDADQARFKASFFWDGNASHRARLEQRLSAVPETKCVFTAGRYVDIMPSCYGKGRAVHFLQRSLGLPPERVVVSGDMGHDAEMFEHGYLGIVPANALDELRSAPKRGRVHESSESYAAAVLDGLRVFGLR